MPRDIDYPGNDPSGYKEPEDVDEDEEQTAIEPGIMASEPHIVGGAVVPAIVSDVMTYYTVIHSYDENGFTWYGTGILEQTIGKAMDLFQGYTGFKHFKIVEIKFEHRR